MTDTNIYIIQFWLTNQNTKHLFRAIRMGQVDKVIYPSETNNVFLLPGVQAFAYPDLSHALIGLQNAGQNFHLSNLMIDSNIKLDVDNIQKLAQVQFDKTFSTSQMPDPFSANLYIREASLIYTSLAMSRSLNNDTMLHNPFLLLEPSLNDAFAPNNTLLTKTLKLSGLGCRLLLIGGLYGTFGDAAVGTTFTFWEKYDRYVAEYLKNNTRPELQRVNTSALGPGPEFNVVDSLLANQIPESEFEVSNQTFMRKIGTKMGTMFQSLSINLKTKCINLVKFLDFRARDLDGNKTLTFEQWEKVQTLSKFGVILGQSAEFNAGEQSFVLYATPNAKIEGFENISDRVFPNNFTEINTLKDLLTTIESSELDINFTNSLNNCGISLTDNMSQYYIDNIFVQAYIFNPSYTDVAWSEQLFDHVPSNASISPPSASPIFNNVSLPSNGTDIIQFFRF